MNEPKMPNKYMRAIKPGVFVDVYDVLKAFNVTCPAMAHGIKKALAPGQRGVKTSIQDKQEAIASLERSIEMERQEGITVPEVPPMVSDEKWPTDSMIVLGNSLLSKMGCVIGGRKLFNTMVNVEATNDKIIQCSDRMCFAGNAILPSHINAGDIYQQMVNQGLKK